MPVLYPVLLLALLMPACSREQPQGDAKAQTTPDRNTMAAIPDFSGARAFDLLLKQTSFGPRNPESQGHDACLQFLLGALRASADEVRTQEFTHIGYRDARIRLTNIIASFKPAAASRILLCAHWDTRPRAERDEDPSRRETPILGANDGASGVAVLLEIAALFKKTPPPVGVDIVLFDGEDYGREGDVDRYLLGSRYFAKVKAIDYQPRFGVLLDMIGDANLEIPKEKKSVAYAPDVVDIVWSMAAQLGVTQFSNDIGDEILDDHVPLNEAGIKTIDLIDFNYPDESHRYWHTHSDTPDHCSGESLEAVGKVLTHVVYRTLP